MRQTLVLTVLVGSGSIASEVHAQPGPEPSAERAAQLRDAREAALRGDCAAVEAIATRLAVDDPTYYAGVFFPEPIIAACNGGVGGRALPPPAAVPAPTPTLTLTTYPEPPPPGPGRADRGRGILGALAGIGAGGVLGFVTAVITLEVAHSHYDCHDICDEELIPVAIGFQVGMSVGLAFGITAVGNHKGGHGRFSASLLGGLAGSALSWPFAASSASVDSGLWGFAYFAFPVAGAITGYWLTHEHDDAETAPVITPATLGPTHAPGLMLSGTF